MKDNKIKCELCGLICSMQISASHLRAKHDMTTKEYRALGYKTLSPARLEQLRQTPVARGEFPHPTGEDHWNYKGGHVAGSGYRIVSRNGVGNLLEHRVIMEEMIGRPLKSNEVVHHIDGNRSNNDPDNLKLMTQKAHTKANVGIKRYFHTDDPSVKEAAIALKGIGWSQSKIGRALRIHHGTAKRWLSNSD